MFTMDLFDDDDDEIETVRTHINKANNFMDQQKYLRAQASILDGLKLDPQESELKNLEQEVTDELNFD